MINIDRFGQLFSRVSEWATRAACMMMVAFVLFGAVPSAQAAGSREAAAVVSERAAAELDRVAGTGTSDQVEGLVDSAKGKAKRDIGRVQNQVDSLDGLANQVDGATDQLKGKVKRDIGQTKAAAADLSEELESEASGLVDSVKELFD